MKLFCFRVEYTTSRYQQVGMEMEYAGTYRAETLVNIAARNEAEAREALLELRIVYAHQQPTITLRETLPIHGTVVHTFEPGERAVGREIV